MDIRNIFSKQITEKPKNMTTAGGKEKTEKNPDKKPADLNNIPNGYYSQIEVGKISRIGDENYPKHTRNNYQGCLLGGAIGDALGWPIEFASIENIKSRYGKNGICDFDKRSKEKAEITDDTQMTIFTADGLLKSALKEFDENKAPDMDFVLDSYYDWLDTQNRGFKPKDKGWISNIPDLYASRAPGGTCLSALHSGKKGSMEKPLNNSKGCGGVMRVAPAGLMYYKNPEIAFETAAKCAALTHGHKDGYLSAGVQGAIIANLVQGKSIEESVNNSIEILKGYEGGKDTLNLLERAKELANSDIDSQEAIKQLGGGWVGDEAIAISVYCALKSPEDFEKAVLMSVNHSGDSDSTGAITGNIMGAYLGADKIPSKWKENVELSNELIRLAEDLYRSPEEIENKEERYKI